MAYSAWAPDRIARNAGDLGRIVDLMDQKKLVEIRTYGQKFMNTPNDKFMLMILGSQAKLENDNKVINVRRGLRARAATDAYPIATFTWILLRKSYGDPAKAQALRDLFAWSLADGQSSAADLGYVPLPPEVVEKAQVALANVKP